MRHNTWEVILSPHIKSLLILLETEYLEVVNLMTWVQDFTALEQDFFSEMRRK